MNWQSIAVIVAAVAVFAYSVHVVRSVGEGVEQTAGNVTERSPAIPSPSSAADVRPISASHGRQQPVALVLGDSYSAGVGASSPSQGYPSLVGKRLGWKMVVQSASGGGYAKPGTNGKTLLQMYAAAHVDRLRPDVVIVQSGLNDVSADDAQTAAAAGQLADQLSTDLPDVPVVVVGEFWPFPEQTPSSQARDAAIEGVWSDRIDVVYLSPLGGGWSDFRTTDDRHPDDAGHRLIADHIIAGLRRADLLRQPA